jgi:hypothetical protein
MVQAIDHYNTPFVNLMKGAQVHKVSADDQRLIAKLIYQEAISHALPIPYVMACIAQESGFDPACYNKNMPLHNPLGTFEGTDWGICQFSGRYLHTKPGMAGLSSSDQRVKALDYTWAIPVFVENMAGLLTWAAEKLVLETDGYGHNYDKYFIATLAYNAGQTEAVKELVTGVVRAHPTHVAHLCAAIAKILGEPNPMIVLP